MNNLPILFHDKVNSPELLALMQQFGENTYLTAEEINKMRDGINELFANIGGNQLIQNTGLTRNGQVFTFQPLWVWKILGEYYSNEQIIAHTVQYAQVGYWRMVLFYANAQNEILMDNGQEVPLSQSPYEPTLPANCVRLTALPVYESSYGNWQEPINGDLFKYKGESAIVDVYNVGSLPNLSVNNESAHFRVHNATELKSLFISDASKVYPGKLFYITNKKNTAFAIPHNASGVNIYQPFIFPNNSGYSVQPNETLTFYWSENKLNYLSSNMVSNKGRVRTILSDFNTNGNVQTQGVTGEVVLKNYTIPAGTIQENCMLRITLKMEKSGTSGICNISFGIGSSPVYPIHAVSFAAANKSIAIYRTPIIKGGNMYNNLVTSGSFITDITSSPNAYEAKSFNVNESQVFSLKVSVTNATDIIRLVSLIVEVVE